MSVERCGEGKNLVFLHGYGSSKESFYYQKEFFKRYFCVTAFDFPSFGNSFDIDSAWGVDDYASWLETFLNSMGITSAYFLAHSFGARVAFKLFSNKSELCEKLIITGGAGLVKPRSMRYIWRVKAYRALKKLFPEFAESHFGSEEYRSLSPVMKASYKKIVNEDLRDYAQKINCPTLLIYGREDGVTPLCEEGAIFNKAIKYSELCAIDGDHFCFCKYPRQFNALCLRFLTE